jgi:hypothetical protein
VAVFVVVAFLAPVCDLYDDRTRVIMDLVGYSLREAGASCRLKGYE